MRKIRFVLGASLLAVYVFLLWNRAEVINLASAGQGPCPEGNGWVKYDDWEDEDKSVTHDAAEGYVVTKVCIFGANVQEQFTEDGIKSCWKVDGIGTQTASASETWPGDEKDSDCKDISHVSFFMGLLPSPTLTLTPTQEPSSTPTQKPSPTPTVTEAPTLTPTLTPTASPEATPTLTVTPSPTPTDVPEVTPTPTDKMAPTPILTPTGEVLPTPTVTPGEEVTPTPTLTPSPTPTDQPGPTATPTPKDEDDDDDDDDDRGGEVLGTTTDDTRPGQILGYADTGSAQRVAEQMFVTLGLGMMVAGVKAIRYAKENV